MHSINFSKQFSSLGESLQQHIVSFFTPITFEKDELLLKKGEISNKLFFIESGIIAEYSEIESDSDFESNIIQTHWILGENEWIFQVRSFLKNEPSDCTIKALEKVKAFYISKKDYYEAQNVLPQVMGLINEIYERYLIQLETRNQFHRIKSAAKRLEYFEKSQKNICNKVQMKYLASYLNISPSELSRIRNKRSQIKDL
jgi:CRP-like cAMP-binding protein